MKIHYSRYGYNGNYTYTSACGQEIKTHQDNEESDIDPVKTNCLLCLQSNEHKVDLSDTISFKPDIKRMIYIESDILQANEFRSAQREVNNFAKNRGLKCTERIFSQVLDFAWHDLENTWKAVKDADEIYATSSLMPLSGGSYTGAPVIFNGMCERATKENITGKLVVILNSLENIEWDMIDITIMKKAFKKNDLYMYNDFDELSKVDLSKVKNK